MGKVLKVFHKRNFAYLFFLILFFLGVYGMYIIALAFAGKIEIPKGIMLGRVQFRFYGMIIVLSVLISAVIFERLAGKLAKTDQKFRKETRKFDIYEALIWIIIPGVLLGRIFYFVQNASMSGVFPEIYKVWDGGLSIFGGVLGGVLGIIIYLKRSKINTFPTLDHVFIAIPLGHAVGRWANFINQEIYGLPTNLPWKMYISPENKVGIAPEFVGEKFYHPLFLYEFILNLVLFGVLYFLFKAKNKRFDGFFISVYLVGYGLIRFFIEFLRLDPKVFLGLSVAQYISVVMVVSGTVVLVLKLRKGK
ncbi:prolipoprotein diacylglyceryl transferase [Candidatus Dojkabacteria bacterium]|nr:prolipoprotein diacylglyceryl transferase [Candidatus Dojkabacteria bacterium]